MHFFGLCLWMAIAIALRFTNLTLKPPWTDEFSTLVFSLGNSYLTIPLDRAISLTDLLQPLQPNPQAGVEDVVHHLLQESNHPPLYFVLTHEWLKLFPSTHGLVSLWGARAFPALLGVLSVPLSFYLGWAACRSLLVAHLAAGLTALSPFGIYLAQEARHYTLAMLWILASLCCLIAVSRYLYAQRLLPIWLCLGWVVVNSLGVATHYFVMFSLLAEAIALLSVLVWPGPAGSLRVSPPNLWRLGAVAAGTLAGTIIWLPFLFGGWKTGLTQWVQGEFDHSGLLDPILRTLAGVTSMMYLLPIQGVSPLVAIASSLVVLLLALGTFFLVASGLKHQRQPSESYLALQLLGRFVVTAIGLSLVITYGFGTNIASVFRYQFFYFPAIPILVGAGLANYWNTQVQVIPWAKWATVPGKQGILAIGVFCLLGGLTVISNAGFQKTHRPDEVAATIQKFSQSPTLIAIPHRTHGQTGRLMGIAWELERPNQSVADSVADPVLDPTFLLAHVNQADIQSAIATLRRTLETSPRPLDVWRINFRSEANPLSQAVLYQQGCIAQTKILSVDGYRYQHFRCQTN
jgi:uncharacterized membrane protein